MNLCVINGLNGKDSNYISSLDLSNVFNVRYFDKL